MAFIGTVVVKYGQRHKHMIERCKNKTMAAKQGKINSGMSLSAQARKEVHWWLDYRNDNPAPIAVPNIDHNM